MIGILDYGMGNLGSVQNACRFLEVPSRIVTRPDELAGCRALILPGVGAFGDCMQHLTAHDFVAPIREWIAAGRPFLGICLGLQLLFEASEESPGVPGLGVLPGRNRRFMPGRDLKVPQIGWNHVRPIQPDCPLFRGIPADTYFYFVHSYYADAAEAGAATAGVTDYGQPYASALWKDNLLAVQFHPEKSQHWGLQMLRNFDAWTRGR